MHHSIRDGRRHERNVQITPRYVCVCFLTVCLDIGTFQTSLCPLAYFTDMPLCPMVLSSGLSHPWHSWQMYPISPQHSVQISFSLSLSCGIVVHVHPCPCSSLHPQVHFVSSDPHLTLRSPLEPWPALLSASSPQKGPWASVGTRYKPHRGFD